MKLEGITYGEIGVYRVRTRMIETADDIFVTTEIAKHGPQCLNLVSLDIEHSRTEGYA